MRKGKRVFNDFNVLSLEANYFRLVYEQKSINGAARKLTQDPGNLSRMIHRLENSIGAKLFVRHKNGLRPTAEGEALYHAVDRAWQTFVESMSPSGLTSRKIRIGFSPTVGHSHFSSVFIDGLDQMNLLPEFVLESSTELMERIKTRELDFALIPRRIEFPALIAKSVAVEGFVLSSSSGKNQDILILNPDLLGAERAIQSIAYKKRWMLKDYFVIAKLLEENPGTMGLFPEKLLGSYQKLKVIKRFPDEGQLHAVTWPGSVGVEFLKYWQQKTMR